MKMNKLYLNFRYLNMLIISSKLVKTILNYLFIFIKLQWRKKILRNLMNFIKKYLKN